MRFGFWPSPTLDWPEMLDLSRHAEAVGFDGLWYADHFMPNTDDPTGPMNESFTMLAGVAAVVPRVRLGHMVAGNTYRHPAITAKMAATIDRISGGRFVLGLGAAWQENEHRRYGIPFYDVRERLERLDEACQVVKSLLSQERTTFAGKHYALEDAPLEPKPVQDRLPLMIGGSGERVTLRIVAKHADEWNGFGSPEDVGRKMEILDRHCAEVGRDPSEIERSVAVVGDPSPAKDLAAVRDAIQAYAEIGIDEVLLPDGSFGETRQQKREVMGQFMEEVASAMQASRSS